MFWRENSIRIDRDSEAHDQAAMAEAFPDEKKKDQSDNKASPILERAIADSKSNTWTLFQLLFILTCVIFGYTVFDPHKLAEFFSTKAARGTTSASSAELATAHKILRENPLIDGHNDLLILIRALYNDHIYQSNFTAPFEEGDFTGHFDLPRADAGQLGGSFWSAWIPCPSDGLDFSDSNYAPYVRATLDQIDLFKRLGAKYPKYFTLSMSAAEAEANFAAGKLISPLAIEGLHQIGNSVATLRLYHELGVRYATLNWNCHNLYSDAAVVITDGVSHRSKPYWHGVSDLGRKLILEMNRLGMLVDLSHVSPDTMRDVLGGNKTSNEENYKWEGSLAPPIFSHSSVYSICPHPRNVPDEILHLVKQRNSLVMINFAPEFISCTEDPASKTGLPAYVDATNTIEHVVSHITYIGNLIGYDHVGLGSDFDGIQSTPRGLESVADFPKLIEMLLKEGVSEEDCAKIAGRNLLRVWHEVDEVKERLEREGLEALEDGIGGRIGGTSVRGEKGGVELDYY